MTIQSLWGLVCTETFALASNPSILNHSTVSFQDARACKYKYVNVTLYKVVKMAHYFVIAKEYTSEDAELHMSHSCIMHNAVDCD